MIGCVAERWTPGIGDPEPTGWLTVAAYLICTGLAVAVWRRMPPGSGGGFWAVLAGLLLFLAVNKQLDLQTALTATGRCLAMAQGWYEARRAVQVGFLAALLVLVVGSLVIGRDTLGGSLREHRLALSGTAILGGFVMMRAVGFHGMDMLIDQRLFGISVNYVFENAGLVLIALNAIAILRRPQRRAAGQV
ncbi:hypothetical protein KTN05_00085 [Paracoccus sp. Z118]|uniref:hypothetical protein n=1 Tax=Paracoccus sp. Z118 TaxID=2851017 RepID=UPI001C2BC835|nr:hypothetical protein [Paracoccus sp. Z118]MBV0890254.1 hypothetical protein [Paracoccus sp. Z118]